ncbi:ComEA family DNA-binding protein [Acinetobacter sp. MD2(2019)]|uniref:ComEA family DNA-binding protein n=1 Tax=Acinetobacter sp. MD2(2019) TaxID=2605273 RepID=UPI002D1F7328|nr:ComEA family DNA-binding protein [Acinetobacter sp. MD2(2019)]MEB3754943.1 ComEA family DNA-binding protein [Acinetobacter sp. MD2(2019)]
MKRTIFALLSLTLIHSASASSGESFDQKYQHWRNSQHSVQANSSALSNKQPSQQVSLNQASALELQQKLTGIGEKKAQAIIQYRQQHGKFNQIDELKNIKGIGEKLFEKNRNKLRL